MHFFLLNHFFKFKTTSGKNYLSFTPKYYIYLLLLLCGINYLQPMSVGGRSSSLSSYVASGKRGSTASALSGVSGGGDGSRSERNEFNETFAHLNVCIFAC